IRCDASPARCAPRSAGPRLRPGGPERDRATLGSREGAWMSSAAPMPSGSLQDARVARLATVDERGAPHLVPVCYATDGHAYYSPIDAKPKRTPSGGLRRVRNIRANPRVALLIDHYEEDWRRLSWMMVQGRAELLSAGPEWNEARTLLETKYPQ